MLIKKLLNKFTVRWSMLDSSITSLELCISLNQVIVYCLFVHFFSPSFIIES